MKFSDIERADWDGLKPYLDTCLLPVTGLSGLEEPWETTQELEYLRDVMDCVEGPYKGRIVTYPAFHYAEGPAAAPAINEVCRKLKGAGFRYVIVISGHPAVGSLLLEDADLLLCPEAADQAQATSAQAFKEQAARDVRQMWQSVSTNGA